MYNDSEDPRVGTVFPGIGSAVLTRRGFRVVGRTGISFSWYGRGYGFDSFLVPAPAEWFMFKLHDTDKYPFLKSYTNLNMPSTWDKVKDGIFRIALLFIIILWVGVPWLHAILYTLAISAVVIGLYYATKN